MVPEYSDDKLATSTLIVVDQMEPVPTKTIGTGSFVIGAMKIRPRVAPANGKPAVFKKDRDQKLNFWMQVYNLSVDQKTNKSSATIEYEIVNTANNQSVLKSVENSADWGSTGDQVTVEKSLPLASLAPGTYQLNIKVNDNNSKQSITPAPSAKFVVE